MYPLTLFAVGAIRLIFRQIAIPVTTLFLHSTGRQNQGTIVWEHKADRVGDNLKLHIFRKIRFTIQIHLFSVA